MLNLFLQEGTTLVCQTRLKRACIVGKDKQIKLHILTGSQVTRKEITLR